MKKTQNGAALVMGLVLLLLMTLLGLTAMRGTTLQERMSGAMHDSNLALQRAESALREGEAELRSMAVFTPGVTGWYDYDESSARPDWKNSAKDPDETGDDGVVTYSEDLSNDNAEAPQYYLERMPPVTRAIQGSKALGDGSVTEDYEVYKVVARGFGNNTKSVVVLESTFRP